MPLEHRPAVWVIIWPAGDAHIDAWACDRGVDLVVQKIVKSYEYYQG